MRTRIIWLSKSGWSSHPTK